MLVYAGLTVNPTSQSTAYYILFPGLPKFSGIKTIGFSVFIKEPMSDEFPYASPVGDIATDNNNTAGLTLYVESKEKVTVGKSYKLVVKMLYCV